MQTVKEKSKLIKILAFQEFDLTLYFFKIGVTGERKDCLIFWHSLTRKYFVSLNEYAWG